jgi:hypothetical protein
VPAVGGICSQLDVVLHHEGVLHAAVQMFHHSPRGLLAKRKRQCRASKWAHAPSRTRSPLILSYNTAEQSLKVFNLVGLLQWMVYRTRCSSFGSSVDHGTTRSMCCPTAAQISFMTARAAAMVLSMSCNMPDSRSRHEAAHGSANDALGAVHLRALPRSNLTNASCTKIYLAHLFCVRETSEAGLVLRGRQVHAVLQHAAVPPRELLAVSTRHRVLETGHWAALRKEEAEHGCKVMIHRVQYILIWLAQPGVPTSTNSYVVFFTVSIA